MKHFSHFRSRKKYFLKNLIIIVCLCLSLSCFSQESEITLDLHDVPLTDILFEIKQQCDQSFLYSHDLLEPYQHISITLQSGSLREALDLCLKGTNLKWEMQDDVIIIQPGRSEKSHKGQTERLTQTIRGRVVDLNTEIPLIGANILLSGTNPVQGTVSDQDGYFELKEVPVGRQSLEISYVGYHPSLIRNLYISSGKEMVVHVKLEETIIQAKEVTVSAYRKDRPLNDMAQIGARSFSVEETERYAGSIGDPSRMASGFAGVLTLGTQVNDIVIRGNSTNALLWRMEGLQIPNPNHFGEMGSTGGTVSMLNNNVLSNSDFYTGAFPAEYGDALSGIFDLKLRSGNQQTREYLAQISFNGLELGAEGPFVKGKRASYMANYRYSTLGVFDLLGLNIGVFAVPNYQDLSFNIDIPTEKTGRFSFFGLGGLNSIGGDNSPDDVNETDSSMLNAYVGFAGINHLLFLNEHSSISTSAGISRAQNKSHQSRTIGDETVYFSWMKNVEQTLEIKSEYKNKLNARNYLKFGADLYYTFYNLNDSIYLPEYNIYTHTLNIDGEGYLIQGYGQWKHRFSDKLSFVAGMHYQYSSLGNDQGLEPRFSVRWELNEKHALSLGGGYYSKVQPNFIYFKEELIDTMSQLTIMPNEDLKMTRSKQIVLGYDFRFLKNHRLKLETYYQYLYNVPVEEQASYKSLINYGSSFSVYEYHSLVNAGSGFNYGVELTLERFLTRGFYYLLTASLFDSKYRGSDDILRNTRFNNNIICNLLAGKEWNAGTNNTFGFDGKITWAKGERRIPLDYEASALTGEAVYIISEAYEERFKDYFRVDVRVYFRLNKNTSHTFSIDIMNVTNRHNHFLAFYNSEINDYEEVSNLDIMPAFVWRWNF